MKSVTPSFDEVKEIIEAHLNATQLKVPHKVVDIDPWAYGEAQDMQFNIGLEPQRQPAVTPVTTAAEPVAVVTPSNPSTNGKNGHVTAVTGNGEVARELSTIVAKRRPREPLTDAQRQQVIILLRQGETKPRIAEITGLGISTIYDVQKLARTAGQLPEPAGSE